MNAPATPIGPPMWLLAEVTYRCPLHCVFCYNPVDFARHEDELSTDDWLRVLREGRELGAVQCGFSGGEPLLRDDLEAKGPVRVSDVETAQKEILTIARRMAEAGEIVLGGKGGEEMI
mgnify:CR=1 FL=1